MSERFEDSRRTNPITLLHLPEPEKIFPVRSFRELTESFKIHRFIWFVTPNLEIRARSPVRGYKYFYDEKGRLIEIHQRFTEYNWQCHVVRYSYKSNDSDEYSKEIVTSF